MGFESFDRAEKAHRADVERLTKIALDVVESNRGSFLKTLANAWLCADSANQRIIKPAWAAIVVKYGLEAEG